MRKTFKSLFPLFLAILMVFNACGVVLADTTPTISMKSEKVNDSVKKLVFTFTANYSINSGEVIFSYDNAVIQPVSSTDYTNVTYAESTTVNIGAPLGDNSKSFAFPAGWTDLGTAYVTANGRTALWAGSNIYAPAIDATSGATILEFYYTEISTPNDQTFQLETTYDEDAGTFLTKFFNAESKSYSVSCTNAADWGTSEYGGGNTGEVNLGTFTYDGIENWAVDRVEITAPTASPAPTIDVPADGSTTANTLQVEADAYAASTNTVKEDATITYNIAPATAGVTISNTGLISVTNAAKEAITNTTGTTLTVTAECKGETDTVEVTVKRAEPVATTIDFVVDKSTLVIPAEGAPDAVATVTTATAKDQYGVAMPGATVTLTENVGSTGATWDPTAKTVTVANGATAGSVTITASVDGIDPVTKTISVTNMVVSWPAESVVKELTYGDAIADAFVDFPTAGTAEADGTINGGFSWDLTDYEAIQNAGTYPVTVTFTADGTGATDEKVYDVVVQKATIDMSGVTPNNVTINPEESLSGDDTAAKAANFYTGLPENVNVTALTFNESADVPTTSGSYAVEVTFAPANDTNYQLSSDGKLAATFIIRTAISGALTLTATPGTGEAKYGTVALDNTIPAEQAGVKWFKVVGEAEPVELTVDGAYTITEADLGAAIISVVAVPTANFYDPDNIAAQYAIPAIAPEIASIATDVGSGEITAVVTVKANGSAVTSVTAYAYDADENPAGELALGGEDANEDGTFTFEFTELENGVEYTIAVTAVNGVGSSETASVTATPKSSSRRGGSSGGSVATSFTVKFDSNGGSEVASATVTKGGKVEAPEAPTKDGFVFDGWYTSKAYTMAYDFESVVNKNFTLYAKWVEAGEEVEPVDPVDPVDPVEDGFVDVSDDAWYAEAVAYVVENGLYSGITETTFGPDDAMTRGMIVTVLYRAAGEPEAMAVSTFSDIATGSYYEKAVSWAQANNIVKGITETEFGPNENVKREQIGAILHRYAEYKGYADANVTTELTFVDNDQISEYAVDDVQYVVANGYMSGRTGNIFAPLADASRAEVATILQRFLTANAVVEPPVDEIVDEVVDEAADETVEGEEATESTEVDAEAEAGTEADVDVDVDAEADVDVDAAVNEEEDAPVDEAADEDAPADETEEEVAE